MYSLDWRSEYTVYLALCLMSLVVMDRLGSNRAVIQKAIYIRYIVYCMN